MNPLTSTTTPTLDPTPTPPEPRPSQLLPGWLAIVISGLLGWLSPLTLAIALGPPNPYKQMSFLIFSRLIPSLMVG
ncbi:hypothetical protein [Isosphaera pallida]|uniref:hypothetical protein n=1 Tax=Isosphaera pallida TaxID=128 RepID=UPI0002FF5882|nr:hypothetical protein [Isosphaera pallida]